MSRCNAKRRWEEHYQIVGFISSGTYGRVYKAINKDGSPGEYAIKKYGSAVLTMSFGEETLLM